MVESRISTTQRVNGERGGCLKLYHGSKRIVMIPEFGKGNTNNDYGQGFYTTEDKKLASEWAGLYGEPYSCYLNEYEFHMDDLKVLHLNDKDTLQWIALLLNNRKLSRTEEFAISLKWVLERKLIDISDYDCIIGWRADDSYFKYAEAFLRNGITVAQLQKAMKLAGLGQQCVLKSRKAFSRIEYTGHVDLDFHYWNKLAKRRDDIARKDYSRYVLQDFNLVRNSPTILMIMMEEGF